MWSDEFQYHKDKILHINGSPKAPCKGPGDLVDLYTVCFVKEVNCNLLVIREYPYEIAHFYHKAVLFWVIHRRKKFHFRKLLEFNIGKNIAFCFRLIFGVKI